MLEWVTWALLPVNVLLLFVNLALNWLARRQIGKHSVMFDELCKCNDEFAEAVALYKYGAHDEAIETAQRATKRRKGVLTR